MPVGGVIATIDTDAEAPEGGAPEEKEEVEPAAKDEPKAAPKEEKKASPAAEKKESYATGTPSPAAKKMMAENGVSSNQVKGTGVDGRITKQDVLAAMSSGFALGVLINFLYAGQHELSHGTVFKTFKLNEFFGRIIGFFMLFPRDFDQIMHFAHHKWTQDWEKDGELVREPFTIKTYLLWFWGVTYWRNRIVGILRRARGVVIEPYINPSEYKKVILESRLHVFGYLIIFILSLN